MMKKVIFVFFVLVTVIKLNAQTTYDDALNDLARKVAQQIVQRQKHKIAVWDFVNSQGEPTRLGKYIAEDFSVTFTKVSGGAYQVMDRNHLRQLLKEHKLNAEGFIDPATAKKLGMMKAADAIITGTVDVLGKKIKIRIKVLDTETALQIAAESIYVPVDANLAYYIGTPGLVNADDSGAGSRGFNRPLNSNEHYNNPETVDQSCATNNTGDFCFLNSLNAGVKVQLEPVNWRNAMSFGGRSRIEMTLDPGQQQCFYNLPVGVYYYRYYLNVKDNAGFVGGGHYDEHKGQILVQKCLSKTFVIRW